jgi:magnesium transporter
MDNVETYRDVLAAFLDIYVSNISNRLNEIMKFLTIIDTIFIPLTFIAGVYGMNFRFIPEIDKWWGYPLALLLMGGTAGVMI